jgi:hypothetical protein
MVRHSRQAAVLVKVLALPTTMVVRVFGAIWSSRYALRSQMRCRYCGSHIKLVRAWRCSCGFTYVGSVLRSCRICGSRPVIVRCEDCGLTWRVR